MLVVETYFRKHTLLRTSGILQFTYIEILINQVELDYRRKNTGKGTAWNYISILRVIGCLFMTIQ